MLGYSDVDAAKLGSLVLWIRPVASVIAGFTADKFKASSVSIDCS